MSNELMKEAIQQAEEACLRGNYHLAIQYYQSAHNLGSTSAQENIALLTTRIKLTSPSPVDSNTFKQAARADHTALTELKVQNPDLSHKEEITGNTLLHTLLQNYVLMLSKGDASDLVWLTQFKAYQTAILDILNTHQALKETTNDDGQTPLQVMKDSCPYMLWNTTTMTPGSQEAIDSILNVAQKCNSTSADTHLTKHIDFLIQPKSSP